MMNMTVYRIGREGSQLPGEILLPHISGHHFRKGTSLAHATAACAILARNAFPCIVIEEDARWLHQSIPDQWDSPWLWIGLSKFMLDAKNVGRRHDPKPPISRLGTIEMGDMLATHGIAYYSAEGAIRMLRAAALALANPSMPIDVAVIHLCRQKKWQRQGLADPAVYQHGINEEATKFRIQSGS